MNPYFIFNNIDSTGFLTIDKLPSIFKPAKDIQKIEIEGRDGFLTQDNGSYKSIVKPVECWIRNLSQIDYICSWLTGGGDVTFSNEPDKIYKATIINQIEFSKIVQQFHSFIFQFDCQPHSYSTSNDIITLTTSGTITNPATANAKPIIKVYGTGTINLTVNSTAITLTNVVDYVTIDSILMDCYKGTILKNNDMSGDFPILAVGTNTINWSGTVISVEITPNFKNI